MNWWAFGSDEMLHSVLGRLLDKVRCRDGRKFRQQNVVLVSGSGDCVEVRRRSCGRGLRKWSRVESCCIHKPFPVHIN